MLANSGELESQTHMIWYSSYSLPAKQGYTTQQDFLRSTPHRSSADMSWPPATDVLSRQPVRQHQRFASYSSTMSCQANNISYTSVPLEFDFVHASQPNSFLNTPESTIDTLDYWSDLTSVYSEPLSDMTVEEPLPSWMAGFSWSTSIPTASTSASTSAPTSLPVRPCQSPRSLNTETACISEPPQTTDVDVLMQKIDPSPSPPEAPSFPVSGSSTCPFTNCAKRFTQSTHLRIHLRSHTGEKPYACTFPSCPSRFSQLGNLRTHERRHQGVKPDRRRTSSTSDTHKYICKLDRCRASSIAGGRVFTQLGNLKAHMNKFHKKTLEKLAEKWAGESLTVEESELREYFRGLFRHCNKGIKGRGKGRKIEVLI